MIWRFSNIGIHVSIDHSKATYDQAKASFDAGVSFVAHLYKAILPLVGC